MLSLPAMDTLELGLKGKVAIVTGASDGLGRATAERFALCGAKVAMASRRPDALESAAQAIQKATGAELLARPTDVSKRVELEALVTSVLERFGGVVKSAQWTRRFKGEDVEAFYADMAKQRRVPLARLGEAAEFADLAAFLVSDRARFITGASVNFDGGAASVV